MPKKHYTVTSDVWLYPGMAGWHFVNIDKKQSEEIKAAHGKNKRGFGSIPVTVTLLRRGSGQVGKTRWDTSIFPDKKSATYILPLKAAIRKKEDIGQGDTISFTLDIR